MSSVTRPQVKRFFAKFNNKHLQTKDAVRKLDFYSVIIFTEGVSDKIQLGKMIIT